MKAWKKTLGARNDTRALPGADRFGWRYGLREEYGSCDLRSELDV